MLIQELCEILKAECMPVGLDATGQVKSGLLLVSGYLIPVKLEYQEPDPLHYTLVHTDLSDPKKFEEDYALDEMGPGQLASGATIYCFGLFKSDSFGVDRWVSSLVLRCVNDASKAYERI